MSPPRRFYVKNNKTFRHCGIQYLDKHFHPRALISKINNMCSVYIRDSHTEFPSIGQRTSLHGIQIYRITIFLKKTGVPEIKWGWRWRNFCWGREGGPWRRTITPPHSWLWWGRAEGQLSLPVQWQWHPLSTLESKKTRQLYGVE